MRCQTVVGEVFVVEAVDVAKHCGEHAPVESVVGGVREVAELVEGVPAAADGGIDVGAAATPGGAAASSIAISAISGAASACSC
ncbi:hypothetical protein [Micromonospora chalcea]|uniref:hypothetical protein n=1 Tax=Micromonospora chalcea TaxID=1874 RepID=UPI0034557409